METIKTSDFIESYIDGVAKGQCVLLLGPRFGICADGKPVHEVVKQQVLDFYAQKSGGDPSSIIDSGFDNFFIFKKKGGPHELLELRFKLKIFYESLQPHPVYEQLARMPFKGIVNCSPDLMLKRTLDRLGVEHAFHYYSPKGSEKQEQQNDLPVLLNIFGRCDNTETFIVNYEDFFKFVMTIMGDDSQIPLNLKNLLTDASFFILLGFDMEKWYVPLLVRKLNQGKESNDRFTVLSKENKVAPEDEQKLSTTLLILEDEAGPALQMLSDRLSQMGALRTPGDATNTELRSLNQLLIEDKLDQLLERLIDQAKNFGLQEHDLFITSGQLASIQRDFNRTVIDNQTYLIERSKVRESIKETLKYLGKSVGRTV